MTITFERHTQTSKRRGIKPGLASVAAACLAIFAADAAHATTLFTSNYAFASGGPVSGSTVIGDTQVIVTSTNTYKNPPGTTNAVGMRFTEAELKFLFSTYINAFSFEFSRLKADEYFTTSLGAPSEITNDYNTLSFFNPSTVTGADTAGDFGTATFLYDNLMTNEVTIKYFTVGPSGALPLPGNANITRFGFTPVPLPPTLLLMGAALGSFGFVARRKRKAV